MPRVAIVVDLGFGDAGKGLLTDFLVRSLGARTVVRFNGGAQAGHNVVAPDGTHHCFSQLGAGMLVPGVRTFLSREVVIDPLALGVEAQVLAGKVGGDPLARLTVDAGARVITPFHRAANRIRERLRGGGAHGSCGVGFGETVQDALAHPEDTVCAGELLGGAALARKLERVRSRKRAEFAALDGPSPSLGAERAVFEDDGLIARWLEGVSPVARRWTVGDASLLGRWLAQGAAVFEGAQGVLLDEQHGFHPHTTWSTCTFAPALALVRESCPEAEVERLGVLRSHAVRHGLGPLPTETATLDGAVHEHNAPHPFQGRVRYGWFDAVLARYALQVTGGVDRLALTHLDLADRLPLHAAEAYEGGSRWLTADALRPLDVQEGLTRALFAARPRLRPLPGSRRGLLESLQTLLGQPVAVTAAGPRANDVRERISSANPARGV
jgi:adenylosuccinate synthase